MTRSLIIDGDVALIPLTKGYTAVIDIVDTQLVEGRSWSALESTRRNAAYAVRVERVAGRQITILLHRHLLNAPMGWQVDHEDGDGLNCRRSNMRLCTHGQNQFNKPIRSDNTSGFKGVSWDSAAGKWKSEISLNRTRRFLGHFDRPEEAHAAYAAAACELYGQFARLA